MCKTITEKHLDFVIRTKTRVSLSVYTKLIFKERKTEDEIAKMDFSKKDNWEGKDTIMLRFRKLKEKGFNRSYACLYNHKHETDEQILLLNK